MARLPSHCVRSRHRHCIESNKMRPGPRVGGQVVQRMVSGKYDEVSAICSGRGSARFGNSPAAENIEAATVTRQPLWRTSAMTVALRYHRRRARLRWTSSTPFSPNLAIG